MKLFVICSLLMLTGSICGSEKSYVLSDEEYAQAYTILAKTPDNSLFTIEQVLKKIERNEIQLDSFLEIGCGPGQITRAVMPYFAKTTLVEPNKKFADAFLEDDCAVYQMVFEDFESDERYDFILCTHVFYHIPQDKWKGVIQKMMDYLTPDGVLVIAMEAVGTEFDLFRRSFNNNYVGSILEKIPSYLKNQMEVIRSDHGYQSFEKEEIVTLCRFLVLEDCFTPDSYGALSNDSRLKIEEKVRSYVEHCKQDDGSFRLDWTQELIFFKR